MNTILFDTETTGLLKPEINDIDYQPYIISLYAVKLDQDFQLIEELDLLVKPPIPIPQEVTKIHGLSDESVNGKKSFEEEADRITDFFFGTRRMVGHNLAYDRSMLANELIRCDRVLKFPWPPEHVCTIQASMFIQQRRMSLSDLHAHCTGKPHLDAHTAKADVYALVRVYHWLSERGRV
jgi:DNA polymerase III subunit epsilon